MPPRHFGVYLIKEILFFAKAQTNELQDKNYVFDTAFLE